MLLSVVSCGRSQKWGCRGTLALGFKLLHGSHDKNHHAALAEELRCFSRGESSRAFGREKLGSFASPFAMQFRKLECQM